MSMVPLSEVIASRDRHGLLFSNFVNSILFNSVNIEASADAGD